MTWYWAWTIFLTHIISNFSIQVTSSVNSPPISHLVICHQTHRTASPCSVLPVTWSQQNFSVSHDFSCFCSVFASWINCIFHPRKEQKILSWHLIKCWREAAELGGNSWWKSLPVWLNPSWTVSACFRAENQFSTSFAGLFMVPSHVFSFHYWSLNTEENVLVQLHHFKVVSLPPAEGQEGHCDAEEENKHLCGSDWQQFVLKLSRKQFNKNYGTIWFIKNWPW